MDHRYNTPYGRSIRVQRLGKDGLPTGGAIEVEAEAFAMTWAGDELDTTDRTALVFAGSDASYRMSWDGGDPTNWTTATTGVTVSPMTNTEAETATHTCAACGEEFATVWEATNPAEHECPGPRTTEDVALQRLAATDNTVRMTLDTTGVHSLLDQAAAQLRAYGRAVNRASARRPVHVPGDPHGVVIQ